jgi:hypothetical protein
VNNELEGTWKKEVLSQFMALFQHILEGIDEKFEKLEDSQSPGRDTNAGLTVPANSVS